MKISYEIESHGKKMTIVCDSEIELLKSIRLLSRLNFFDYPEELKDNATPIEELDISIRSSNALIKYGITTIEQYKSTPEEEFFKIRNFGKTCREEVKIALERYNNG